MKKARMIVSAIAVFAVVSSSLAFKVFHPANVFCANSTQTACNVKKQFVNFDTGTGETSDPCADGRGKYNIGSADNSHDCGNNTTLVYDATTL